MCSVLALKQGAVPNGSFFCITHLNCAFVASSLILKQFSRTLAPDTSKGPALIAFMQHNKWKRIAMLSSTENLWFETRLGLAKQLEAAHIEVFKPEAFVPGNMRETMLSSITRSGLRIMAVLAYNADVQTLASLARWKAMTGGWGWLVVNVDQPGTASADLQSWLYVTPFLAGSDELQAFAKQVSGHSRTFFDLDVSPDLVDLTYSAALHDAIMLYAHAATRVLSEGRDIRDGHLVTAAVRNTSFTGTGGTLVELDSNGDRIQSYEIMNYVLQAGNVMGSVAVGMFNSTLRQYKAYEQTVVWPGNTTEIPADYFSGELR